MSSDIWESAHNTHWKSFYKSELHVRDTREDTRSSAVEALSVKGMSAAWSERKSFLLRTNWAVGGEHILIKHFESRHIEFEAPVNCTAVSRARRYEALQRFMSELKTLALCSILNVPVSTF